jgi:hypothetical protein
VSSEIRDNNDNNNNNNNIFGKKDINIYIINFYGIYIFSKQKNIQNMSFMR